MAFAERERETAHPADQSGKKRPALPERSSPNQPILKLQRWLGNRTVGRLITGDHSEHGVSEKQPAGRGLIERLRGRLHVGPTIDAALRWVGARAATLGRDVYVRSDITATPSARRARETFAHEAIHLLQQREATGAPARTAPPRAAAEYEARAGAADLLNGQLPQVQHRDANPVLRFQLDPDADFEPGTVPGSLADVQANRMWVDNDILNYELSQEEPWTFTILYNDGGLLVIPLTRMWGESISGPKVTFFRRHRSTGRIVPFQASQDALRPTTPAEGSAPGTATLLRRVPPRFDPTLTPFVSAYLDQAQILFVAEGFTRVFALHLMNPLLLGWGAGAAASSSTRSALARIGLRRGATAVAPDAAAIGEGIFTQVSRLGGSNFQKFLELARRLSGTPGLTPQAKANLLQNFAGRLGLEVGGQVAKEGGRILLIAKDGRTALQIAADGGITFGRFSLETLDIVNPTVIRAFAP